MSPQEVEDMVLYQIGALAAIAQAEGVRLHHVKPHGALYNMAAKERALAEAIARAVAAFDPALSLFGPPRSGSDPRGRGMWTASRPRRICRSRVRAGWLAHAEVACRGRHSRERRRRAAGSANGGRGEGQNEQWRRAGPARRNYLCARRHARRAVIDPRDPELDSNGPGLRLRRSRDGLVERAARLVA